MPGLGALTLARRALRPGWPARSPDRRRIRRWRLRRIPGALAKLRFETLNPAGQLLDLAIHPQQDLDHHITTRVINRLSLGPFHTPIFDTPALCPPDQLNAYTNKEVPADLRRDYRGNFGLVVLRPRQRRMLANGDDHLHLGLPCHQLFHRRRAGPQAVEDNSVARVGSRTTVDHHPTLGLVRGGLHPRNVSHAVPVDGMATKRLLG
jgi:hypothetical protein